MAHVNLNLVLKTVLGGSSKLLASADRIGSGFATAVDNDPAHVLSPGLFPEPRLSEPEPRSRQEVADMPSPTPAAAPASSVGSFSGTRACRRPFSAVIALPAIVGQKRTIPPGGVAVAITDPTGTGRYCRLGSPRGYSMPGRDCQSPVHTPTFDRDHQPGLHPWQSRTVTTTPATTAAI